MKQYPKITNIIDNKHKIYAFDKLDGSNIRAEWSRKQGFYKFGSRKILISESDKVLGESIDLFKNKYLDILEEIFRKNRWKKAMCFFEFYGKNSFAGVHIDEPHDVVLFDVARENSGIMEPKDFLKMFGHIHIPSLLYTGMIDQDIIVQIHNGDLLGMTFEGVVCKGKYISPGLPLMFKIKNKKWIEKVKSIYTNPDIIKELL